MTHENLILLNIAFTVFNALRVWFYIPSFRLMVKQKNNLQSHSLFTWASWIFANATVGIYFVILSGIDEKAILNFANAFMCLVGFSIILYKRSKYEDSSESDKDTIKQLMEQNKKLKDLAYRMKAHIDKTAQIQQAQQQ